MALRDEAKCVVCGCSESRACPEGCSWAFHEPPVCSSCVGPYLIATLMGVALSVEGGGSVPKLATVQAVKRLRKHYPHKGQDLDEADFGRVLRLPSVREVCAINRRVAKWYGVDKPKQDARDRAFDRELRRDGAKPGKPTGFVGKWRIKPDPHNDRVVRGEVRDPTLASTGEPYVVRLATHARGNLTHEVYRRPAGNRRGAVVFGPGTKLFCRNEAHVRNERAAAAGVGGAL